MIMVIICCGGLVPPCEHDKREIANLILFKKKWKKPWQISQMWYNKSVKRKRV